MRTITLPSFSIQETGSSDVLTALDITESKADFLSRMKKAITENSRTTRDVVKIAETCLRSGKVSTKELIALALLKGFEVFYDSDISTETETEPTPTPRGEAEAAQDDDLVLKRESESEIDPFESIEDKLDLLVSSERANAEDVMTELELLEKILKKLRKISKKL